MPSTPPESAKLMTSHVKTVTLNQAGAVAFVISMHNGFNLQPTILIFIKAYRSESSKLLIQQIGERVQYEKYFSHC